MFLTRGIIKNEKNKSITFYTAASLRRRAKTLEILIAWLISSMWNVQLQVVAPYLSASVLAVISV